MQQKLKTHMQKHKKDAKHEKMSSRSSEYQTSSYTSFGSRAAMNKQRQLEDLKERSQSAHEDPLYRKARKWWQRVDDKYFNGVTLEELERIKKLSTSNQIIRQFNNVQGSDCSLANYRQEMLESVMPSLADKNKLKVLIREVTRNNQQQANKSVLITYELQSAIPNYHNEVPCNLQDSHIHVHPVIAHNFNTDQNSYSEHGSLNQLLAHAKSIRLDIDQYSEDPALYSRVERYQQAETQYKNSLDREIALWQSQLQQVNNENRDLWDRVIGNYRNSHDLATQQETSSGRYKNELKQKILHIQDKLQWVTVLRSFEAGFKDKTYSMLESYIENEKNFASNSRPPKGTVNQPKKYFETDCKICFCSDNSDSNQVLYCDNCNTSFHLACYGLNAVPKEDEYFCEKCIYVRQNSYKSVKPKSIICQICLKSSFPMKKIDDHFYHVTCLILFNLVSLKNNQMILRDSLSHRAITKMVMENQIEASDDCDYCRKKQASLGLGMRIQCSYDECKNYFHPICAYLSGCKIMAKRTKKDTLETKLICNFHFAKYARVQQIYLRRYMLNFNEVSSKTMNEFQQLYEEEFNKYRCMKDSAKMTRNKYPNRIFYINRSLHSWLTKNLQDKEEGNIQTETEALLKQLKRDKYASNQSKQKK